MSTLPDGICKQLFACFIGMSRVHFRRIVYKSYYNYLVVVVVVVVYDNIAHRHCRNINKITAQCPCCLWLSVSMPLLMAGSTLGWSSPMMEYTLRGTAPVLLTSDQESWMVTLIDVGNVLLSLPAGIMMDKIGRKMSVYLTVPITLAGWILILFARQVRRDVLFFRHRRRRCETNRTHSIGKLHVAAVLPHARRHRFDVGRHARWLSNDCYYY